MENYESIINDYIEILKQYEKISYQELYDICKQFYELLYVQVDYYKKDKFEKESGLVKICIRVLIPILEDILTKYDLDSELMMKYFELYEESFYFAGRRSFRHYLLAMEFKFPKKIFKHRLDLFDPIIYYLNKLALDDDIDLMRISMPPGYAKSLSTTLFTTFVYGIDMSKSVLRVSSSDLLVKQFGRDTVAFLKSEEHCKIFPQFKNDLFLKKTEDEFQFKNSNERNFLCKTRDSTIVGFRIGILMLDDLIGGTQEAMNSEIHASIRNKYKVDWCPRAKNQNTFKTLAIGTMFSPDDLLSTLKEDAMKDGELQETPYKKYVEVYKNKNSGKLQIFITIPALDENDVSTLESVYSTRYYIDLRDNLLSDKSGSGKYFWQSTFMQDPVSPTGLDFAYDNLIVYDSLPKNEEGEFLTAKYCIASLDPNRKGNDYIAMPIFVPYENKFYLIDFLFKKGAIRDIIDEIVEKIIRFNITSLYVEINVDNSLPILIKKSLEEKGFNGCRIVEIYSSIAKEQRIKDNQGNIKRMVVFPDKKLWLKISSEMKIAMEQIISFSFDRPNKHDDGIDSVCLMIMENLPKLHFSNTLELLNRSILGI